MTQKAHAQQPTEPSESGLDEQLRAYVRQAAETAKVFGVDFLPVHASGVLGVTIEAVETKVLPSFAEPAKELSKPSAQLEQSKAQTGDPASKEGSFVNMMAKNISKSSVKTTPAAAGETSSNVKLTKDKQSESLMPLPSRGPAPKVSAETAAARTPQERQAAMDELRARYEAAAPHKRFETPHTTVVWGEGNLLSQIMFVGEAPGEEEDKSGRPFVGRAGKLLTDMIAAMGITREQVYIANIVKVRPPNNATPTPEQCAASEPYLIEQIAIVSPKVVVTLGLPSTRTLLKRDETMGAFRGTWSTLNLPDGRLIEVMPTYHPSYVLRSYTDEVRGKVWSDLQQVMKRLGMPLTPRPKSK